MRLGRCGYSVLHDQRATEFRLPAHELKAVALERPAARAGPPQFLPFVDECADSLSQRLDVGLVALRTPALFSAGHSMILGNCYHQ